MNEQTIVCWNEVLGPRWLQYRRLVSAACAVHSDIAYRHFTFEPGESVLDVACGFGDTTIELGRLVGPDGDVLGIDCSAPMVEAAEKSRAAARLDHVRFVCADAGAFDYAPVRFDAMYSRFGIMLFDDAVAALQHIARAMKPAGRLHAIVWRTLDENPFLRNAREIVLHHLPAPDEDERERDVAPGPFAWGDRERFTAILEAAGFGAVEASPIDADICVGRSVEEAVDYQTSLGPAASIIREAGAAAEEALPAIHSELRTMLAQHAWQDGYYLPSASWAITARLD